MPPKTAKKTPPPIKPPRARGPKRLRALKYDDELWEAAQARAAKDGLTMTALIEHYLRGYTGLE
jgi:hypothetical protein